MMNISESVYNFKKRIKKIWTMYFTINGEYTCILPDKIYLKKRYLKKTGRKLDLRNPKTFSEKGNWLKLHDRRPEYTVMADKYLVREYIENKIGKGYLLPLLGVWDSPDKINFEELPNEFVLKCNHDNGVIICRDKASFDFEAAKQDLSLRLKRGFYKKNREWPYKNIPRRIICEPFMKNTNGKELVDYKLFCFGGKVAFTLVRSDTFSSNVKHDYYDDKWIYMCNVTEHLSAGDRFSKPSNYEKMVSIAEKLSVGIPFLRVDFNYWDDDLYVGELTFFPVGSMGLFNDEYEDAFGKLIILPKND